MQHTLTQLASILTDWPNADPEFDNAYEELEREFASLRLTIGEA